MSFAHPKFSFGNSMFALALTVVWLSPVVLIVVQNIKPVGALFFGVCSLMYFGTFRKRLNMMGTV